MTKNMEEKEFQHPEGKIQLLDGRVLDCYPLEQPQGEVDNQLSLDTTGVYLSLKKPNKANTVKDNQDEDEKLLEKLFLDNAFVLLNNRERILSDSRMFLCPLPIRNGLAYTGTSGFHHPTLGIYIEFWLNCPAATIMKENREKWLLWHISGSPLSGSNRCSLVNPQGETTCEQVRSFKDIWPPFMEINTRYDEAKSMYDAYTLRQVLSIFENEGIKVAYKKNTNLFFLEQANKELKRSIRSLKAYTEHLYTKLHKALLELKCVELKAFMAEYNEREEAMAYRLAQIQHERLELRKQLKSNEIDGIQYQKLWMPFHKEKKQIVSEMNRFVDDALHTLYPDDSITLSEVKDFLEKDSSSNVDSKSEEIQGGKEV